MIRTGSAVSAPMRLMLEPVISTRSSCCAGCLTQCIGRCRNKCGSECGADGDAELRSVEHVSPLSRSNNSHEAIRARIGGALQKLLITSMQPKSNRTLVRRAEE